MRLIPLTKGKSTKVDDKNYLFLMQWKWYAKKGRKTYYAVRSGGKKDKSRNLIMMHNVIFKVPVGKEPDHIDRDGLNNQENNLRVSTHSQNLANKTCGGKSKYLGVTIRKDKYIQAQIMVNQERIYLGLHKTEELAAFAYDTAAKRLHGEFANLNFK